jgi:multidrug efflux pump
MQFTDIFIRRPVLASVVSLLILVLGLRAYAVLPILQFPRTENALVTVTTIYYGADPDVVAGFITTPLENAIAQANGIDYMNSVSQSSVSTITVTLRLNYDADKALTEINTKVASVLNQLPPGTLQPTLTVKIGQTIDAMYIGFNSDTLAPNQITDYLTRVVQPKLQAVPGVQTAELLGQKVFALRAWLDPQKLAAFGLTATDVSQALTANDYISGIGNTKGQMVQVNLAASTSLHSAEEFRNLVIKQSGGAIVRLKDVANVTLGAEDYESEVGFDGKQAVYIGILVAPTANLLEVVDHLRFHRIRAQRYQRGDPQSRRGADHRDLGGFPLLRFDARIDHPDGRHSAVAGRHAHYSSGARLFDQPVDAAGAGSRDRAGGRRRHHRGRERQPPSRGRHGADGRRHPGGA